PPSRGTSRSPRRADERSSAYFRPSEPRGSWRARAAPRHRRPAADTPNAAHPRDRPGLAQRNHAATTPPSATTRPSPLRSAYWSRPLPPATRSWPATPAAATPTASATPPATRAPLRQKARSSRPHAPQQPPYQNSLI